MSYFSRIVSLNLLALSGVTIAMAATAPLSDPTIIAHFDIATLQQPEDIALEPDGSAVVTFNRARTKGAVWRISLRPGMAGTVALWAQGVQLQPTSTAPQGANGIEVHNGAVWVSNTALGTLMSIPTKDDGTAGTITTKATGLTAIDNFAFTGNGDVVAALNYVSEVSIVHQDGTHVTVLTSSDGLSNPTSIAVKGSTVYIASAAYFTRLDPNLMVAHFDYGQAMSTDAFRH